MSDPYETYICDRSWYNDYEAISQAAKCQCQDLVRINEILEVFMQHLGLKYTIDDKELGKLDALYKCLSVALIKNATISRVLGEKIKDEIEVPFEGYLLKLVKHKDGFSIDSYVKENNG